MLKLPIFTQLEQAKRILIAGAGGGYDVFCGLPLYFGLCSQGKEVYLANLTFSQLPQNAENWLSSTMLKVDADTPVDTLYFPEYYLSRWFREKQHCETAIYCFEKTGVAPLKQNYELLVQQLELDTIILVDGGTDSLMRGDEDGLGSFQEDVCSIAAVDLLDMPRKFLVCLGFGVDHYHGVSNDLSLAAIAELTQENGFLGMFSLLADMPEVEQYRQAITYVHDNMPGLESIVANSILSSLEGHYGNYHRSQKTQGSVLWINPLMANYLCFDLALVAERNIYLSQILFSQEASEALLTIAEFRMFLGNHMRQRGHIPS